MPFPFTQTTVPTSSIEPFLGGIFRASRGEGGSARGRLAQSHQLRAVPGKTQTQGLRPLPTERRGA